MLTEKGVLPIGVEFNGKVHRDFIIRPKKVKDSVEALDDPRAGKSDAFFGVCVMSRQVEKLGDIPKKDITADLLAEMYEEDFRALNAASERLAKRLASFRAETEKEQTADPGSAKDADTLRDGR